MPALLKGLQDCTEDLQRYWNMGDRTLSAKATPAKGDLRGIFNGDDYPADALR